MKKLLIIALWLIVIALAIMTWSGCAPEPMPTPEPEPTRIAQATHELYFPRAVIRSWPEMPQSKRGIGVVIGMEPPPNYHVNSVTDAGGQWWHNWSMWASRGQSVAQNGATFVPTLWGYGEPEFIALAEMCVRGFTGPLMWLNEPNHRGQANKSPAEAVAILERILSICPGVQAVGPRLSHEDWTHGFPWIMEFWSLWRNKYGTLPPTTPAIHGYLSPFQFRTYLRDYSVLLAEFGWPAKTQIWIPEWNVPCGSRSPEQLAPLFAEVAQILDESKMVAYHAPFALYMARYWPDLECAQLRDESGRLTAVGQIYRGGAGTAQAAYP